MKFLIIPLTLLLGCSPLLSQTIQPPSPISARKPHQIFISRQYFKNTRLFLNYSVEKPPVLEIGDHHLELPTGQNVTVDLTYEHVPDHPATIHLFTLGNPTAKRIEIPETTISGPSVNFKHFPGEDSSMDQGFTLLARYKTTAENGNLASRSPTEGKWAKGGKPSSSVMANSTTISAGSEPSKEQPRSTMEKKPMKSKNSVPGPAASPKR